jgi:diguanylate cyclase (GGDEF)-like protein/PAS domain S-box-containing protein
MWKIDRRRLRRARLSLPTPLAVLTLLGGVAVTCALYVNVRDVEHERARSDFVQAAESRFSSVERSFSDAAGAVHSLNLLFSSVGEVSRAEFDAYAIPLAALHPEAQALVFHRFVSGEQRAAFEASRAALFPGFRISERGPNGLVRAGERPLYLVDDYIVPFAGNEVTLGYDAWSHPPQRMLAQYAIDTGEAAASEVLPLLQHDGAAGVVIVMPVYRQGMPLSTVAERRRAVIGDTEVVLDLAALVRRNLAGAGLLDRPGTMLTLASTAADGKLAAWRFGTAANLMAQGRWGRWLRGPGFSLVRNMHVAGRPWRLTVAAREGALPLHLGSVGMLAFGIGLSIVGAGYVQSRVRRTRRIESLVEERTGALKRASDALRLYQRAIESSANAILLVSARQPGWPIEYANPAYQRLRGQSARELVGQRLSCLASAEPDQPSLRELAAALRARRAGHALVRHHDASGSELYSEVYVAPVLNQAGDTEHFVMSLHDVTTAKRYEAELEHRARHDGLTGLANRVLLEDRIEQALGFGAANGEPVWVAALDLDQFRFVNDTLGHHAGDQLLQLLAPRISGALGRADSVARTGGDEFVLVLAGYRDERQAAAALRSVLDAVAQPLTLLGQTLAVTCSAGVAAYPGDGADSATLIKHAELAMYRAKDAGRNAVEFFRPAMTARARERLELEGALRHALARDEFELHYQPQVALASGRVVGLEALIRWRHPQFGTVHPDRFIGLAEETGLIVPIGGWVLRTACQQNRAWQKSGYGPLRVAVNLSARQFAEPSLRESIGAALDETGLHAQCLEIEVTESMMMADVDSALATMHELKSMGVGLSIDDFGTGYSSLAYLKRFPADVLKIDRSFVHDLPDGGDDGAMVDAIIAMARGLHMRVIAEGVETRGQLEHLRSQGCDEVQGFLYSRALPALEVEPILRDGHCLAAA